MSSRSAATGWILREARRYETKGRRTLSLDVVCRFPCLPLRWRQAESLRALKRVPGIDWLLLMTAMGLTAAVAMRLLADNSAEREVGSALRG